MADTTGNRGGPASAGSGDALNRAGSDLRATAADAKSQATDAASRVRDEAAGAYADVKAEAAGVVDAARERATGFAEQQKNAGAEQAEGLARAVHRAADELQEGSPQLAQFVREAAASVQQISRTMRDRDLGSLLGDVEGIARQQPVAFFGAAMLAGFALSRFLKSSAPGTYQGAQQGGGHTPAGEATAPSHSSPDGGSSRVRVIPASPPAQGAAAGFPSTASVVGAPATGVVG